MPCEMFSYTDDEYARLLTKYINIFYHPSTWNKPTEHYLVLWLVVLFSVGFIFQLKTISNYLFFIKKYSG